LYNYIKKFQLSENSDRYRKKVSPMQVEEREDYTATNNKI
jgi:hypothetical protein